MRSHYLRSSTLNFLGMPCGLATLFFVIIGMLNPDGVANAQEVPDCADQSSSRVMCNGYKICVKVGSSADERKPVQVSWALVNHLQQCPDGFEEFDTISDIQERGWVEKLLGTAVPAVAQFAAGLVVADPPPCPVLENTQDFSTNEGEDRPSCVDKGVKGVMSEPYLLFKRYCITFTKKRECKLEVKPPRR